MFFSRTRNKKSPTLLLLLTTGFLLSACASPKAENKSYWWNQTQDKNAVQYIVVREGETLESIAAKTGTSVPQLAWYNGIKRPYTLREGERVYVPPREYAPVTNADGAAAPVIDSQEENGDWQDPLHNTPPVDEQMIPAPQAAPEKPVPQTMSPIPAAPKPEKKAAPAQKQPKKEQKTNKDIQKPSAQAPEKQARDTSKKQAPKPQAKAEKNKPSAVAKAPPASNASPVTKPKEKAESAPAPVKPIMPPSTSTPTPNGGAPATTEKPATGGSNASCYVNPIRSGHVKTLPGGAVSFTTSNGQAVYASGPGQVAYVGSGVEGLGLLVIIKSEADVQMIYANLAKVSLKEGDLVKKNQQIGVVAPFQGATQLHFEVRKNIKSVDSLAFLQKNACK